MGSPRGFSTPRSECPPKGDISDWIAAGGTSEKLLELIEALPDWGASQASPAEPLQGDAGSLGIPDTFPAIDDAAYSGLVGEIVQTILPHTEADAAALLIQTLVMAGNVIGRAPYYQVEASLASHKPVRSFGWQQREGSQRDFIWAHPFCGENC